MNVRTSKTDPIYVATLLEALPGSVGITFAPGKHGPSKSGGTWARDLTADLDKLVADGMNVLVCLLEDHELTRLRIPALIEETKRRGVEVLRLPITDGGVLPSQAPVQQLVVQILERANSGKNVVVHCMGGLGRAGTIGGCVLRAHGMDADAALARLREKRGKKCPETEAQRQFIRTFSA